MGDYISQKFLSTNYQEATGEVRVNMTNDYMFRAVLQENNEVLIALICSVLHLPRETVHSAEITNPIILGEHMGEKEVALDVNVYFDDASYINLEMQVADEGNWTERSLYYMCRNYSRLNKGDSYMDAKSSIQVGFLDFDLFEDEPAFFSNYYMCNPLTKKIYSDKLRIAVLNLTQIDSATDEDKRYRIDTWARLFKARTWEEIRMLATEDKAIEKAAGSIYALSADEAIMWECEARADYARRKHDAQVLRERLERDVERAEQRLAKVEQERAKAEQERTKAEQERAKAEQERNEALDLAENYRRMLLDRGIQIEGAE